MANGLDRGADIDSLADRKGKTVATNAVDAVDGAQGPRHRLDLAGGVDLPVEGPWEQAHVPFRLNDGIEPFVQLLNGCRRGFVDDHRDAIAKLQQDWARVADWFAAPADRAKVIEASAAATKIPKPVLERFLLTDQDYHRPPRGRVSVDALQREWDFFHEHGGIKKDLQVSEHVLGG